MVAVTERCNISCRHCRTVRSDRELTLEQAKAIANKLSGKTESVNLTGGEPLLHKDIFDIIRAFKNNGISVTLSTNGSFLSEDVAKKLRDCGLDGINISLDSIKKETQDSFRGKDGAWEDALNAIRVSTKYLSTRIAVAVGKFNKDETEKLISDAYFMGCSGISFRRILPVGKIYSEVLLNGEEYGEYLKTLYTYIRIFDQIDNSFTIFIEDPHDVYFYGLCTDSVVEGKGCESCSGIIKVKANGDIFPCPAIPIKLGNIFFDELEDIKNTLLFTKLKNREFVGKCNSCEIKQLCGGCRALSQYIFSSCLDEDRWCQIDKKDWIIDPHFEIKREFTKEDIPRLVQITRADLKGVLESSGIEWKDELLKQALESPEKKTIILS
jgi:radical SAM protein with 4Fe4S-binding SPASM domain